MYRHYLHVQGPVLWWQVAAREGASIWGSITNTTMLSGFLQTSIKPNEPWISVALHLLDSSQLSISRNDFMSSDIDKFCSAGSSAPSCSFHATNLNASALYCMILSHADATHVADAGSLIADVTAAFSGASSCGSLQCPGALCL